MTNRIKVYPPKGGDPVEVYELDAGRLILKGWTLTAPVETVEAAAEIEVAEESATDETVTDEGLTDGNNQGKRRHRKGRL